MTQPDDLTDRLAATYEELDQPPGVVLGVLRLPTLDPILDELEASEFALSPGSLAQVARLVDLLATGMLGTASGSVQPRGRLVEVLRRATGGQLPPEAADAGDPFGLELRAMLGSDASLRHALGMLYPLALAATSPAPSARWLRAAHELAASPDSPRLIDGTHRVLAALVRAPVESRPDVLAGGVRPVNQRLARGLLWFGSIALEQPAETLMAAGLRMGTSGRRDAVVRDVALANTCAVLLGQSADPGAAAALASMRSHVTNRNVLKQVDRALATLAASRGTTVDELVDMSLPTFGLGSDGRQEITAGEAKAVIAVTDAGTVEVRWHGAELKGGTPPSGSPSVAGPAVAAEVARTANSIEAALAEERQRLEERLGSIRHWLAPVWRARFADHPVAGPFGRRLVWVLETAGSPPVSILPVGDGWIGIDERPVDQVSGSASLRLWHPAEATEADVVAWRATLAARAVEQPFRQVDREVFRAEPEPGPPNADRRFAGRTVDHATLRALLRGRGWAVPALGAWDQGDEATGWRAFDGGVRAELRYQVREPVGSGARVQEARIVAVRFIRTEAAAAAPATDPVSVPVAAVPRRVFSEALRDVSLAVAVGG